MSEYETVLQGVSEALRLCLAGDGRAGLKRYRKHVRRPIAGRMPLGLHIHLLAEAGHAEIATTLRTLTLSQGGDLSWRASSKPGGAPEIAVAEYEDWFAQDLGNPCMIDRYIRALTALGRSEGLPALFDADRLIRRTMLPDPEAVAEALLAMEGQLDHGSMQVTHGMGYLNNLEDRGHPVFDRLFGQLHDALDRYFADWRASGHRFAPMVPQGFTVTGWALLSRENGYNARHIHPRGWATGVYYPRGLPEGSLGGQLKIGGWEDPTPPGWPEMTIVPEAGMLLIFPSWYVHWTEPTGIDAPRMSIAFDALPAL